MKHENEELLPHMGSEQRKLYFESPQHLPDDLPLAVDYLMGELMGKSFSVNMKEADFTSLYNKARAMEIGSRKEAIHKAPIILIGNNLWAYKEDGKVYVRPTSDMAECRFEADINNGGFYLCRKCGRAKQQHEPYLPSAAQDSEQLSDTD